MNVALPALIVFLILLPGFIFRANLKRAERTSLDFSPFGQVFVGATTWALLLHFIWLLAAEQCLHYVFEPALLIKLLSPAINSSGSVVDVVGRQFNHIVLYFGTLIIGSSIIPAGIRWVVSRYRLDRSSAHLGALFRFRDAPWYYTLSAADFKASEVPDYIIISAIVELGKDTVLYCGVLDEFFVDAEGQLDRLVLQAVTRRTLACENPATSVNQLAAELSFYDIGGDLFVLRYSEAITLNIQYVRLTRSASA